MLLSFGGKLKNNASFSILLCDWLVWTQYFDKWKVFRKITRCQLWYYRYWIKNNSPIILFQSVDFLRFAIAIDLSRLCIHIGSTWCSMSFYSAVAQQHKVTVSHLNLNEVLIIACWIECVLKAGCGCCWLRHICQNSCDEHICMCS